tara:strand:+ start:63 stop:455 length:393 start_codon:yes stop_codon:yes gene_type:complete
MNNLKKPPQHLLDAIKQGKEIDPKDPWVRKMMREEKKKEKKEKELRKQEEERIFEQWKIRNLLAEHERWNTYIEEINNTILWNCEQKCKYCDSKSMRVVTTPKFIHYAKYVCNLCDRMSVWIPYPRDKYT